jgi:hypothetical protein
MNFKNWLILTEHGNPAQITINPEINHIPTELRGSEPNKWLEPEEIKETLTDILRRNFAKLDPRGWQYAKERYSFHAEKIKKDYEGIKFTIHIKLIQPKGGQEELAGPDDEYYQKYHGGKTGRITYKTPKDAIAEIPADPNLAYRGMSWEEWQDTRKKGHIQSRGIYNLGKEQEGITLFGYKPDTAEHYANSFAPLQYQIGYRKPGIVIAVPKALMLTHQDDPRGIPSSELGYRGPLDAKYIQHVWMLIPTSSNNSGKFELTIPWKADWDINKYKDPRTGFFVLDVKEAKVTSGIFSAGQGYTIRKLI